MMSVTGWPELVAWVAAMWFVVRPLGRGLARPHGLTRRDKALLTLGFAQLGAERVAAGLEATGHEWQNCFLALATASDGRAPSWIARVRGWDRVPGVRPSVTRTLAAVWDRDERGFRDLAAAWLERTPVSTTATHDSHGSHALVPHYGGCQ